MNLSPRWISVLADVGIEAAHWLTLGAKNAPDVEIMAYASTYVRLTHDLDFSAILAATHGEKPSVVQIRAEDVNPDVIGKSSFFTEATCFTNQSNAASLIPYRRLRYRATRGWTHHFFCRASCTISAFSRSSAYIFFKRRRFSFLSSRSLTINEASIPP